MGWLLVNLVLPAILPFLMLAGCKLADLSEPYKTRTQLARAARDGQLGWVAMSFAASCTYDLWHYVVKAKGAAPDWTGPVIGSAIAILILAGALSTLGVVFPFNEEKQAPTTRYGWVLYYRMMFGTLAVTMIAAGLFALVHFNLPELKD